MNGPDYKRIAAQRKTSRTLKRRKPAEWKRGIDRLPCGRVCRLMVACIVWWDYFAKKTAIPHDDTLDAYKRDWDYMVITGAKIRVKAQSIAKALIALGYDEAMAAKRSEVVS